MAGWIALAVTLFWTTIVDAQQRNRGLQSAGGDANFRVIERFPDESKAESTPTLPDALLDDLRAEDWSAARDRIETLKADASGEPDWQLSFVDAYVAFKMGDAAEAAERFESLAARAPKLVDYALYLGAKAALEADEPHRAVMMAAQIPPTSLKYGPGLGLLGRALLDAGGASDVKRAIRVMHRYLEMVAGGAARQVRFMLGETLAAEGSWQEAADQLIEVWKRHPLSDVGQKARSLLEDNLSKLTDAQRDIVSSPPREFTMAYFQALFDGHHSRRLIDELADPLKGWTAGTEHRCRGLYWMAKSHTKLREHRDAASWYQKVLEECRGIEPWERMALYNAGRGYWNVGERRKALEIFETLWTRFDHHSFADDAMYFAGRIHRERNDGEAARAILREQVKKHPDGDMAAQAHWLLVREMMEAQNWSGVIDYVDGLESTGEEDRDTIGRLGYMRARSLQKMGRNDAARDAYRRVTEAAPMTYYGLLAGNRLRDSVEATGADWQAWCQREDAAVCRTVDGPVREYSVPGEVEKDMRFQKGVALLHLGLQELARGELKALFEAFGGQDSALKGLADLLSQAGAHPMAHRLPDRIDGWKQAYPTDQTRRLWEISYPRAFERIVRKWSDERGLTASFVWAIMRKESAFTPRIKSWAGARGLLQLMPGTADMMARRQGVDGVDNWTILQPDLNVRLGTAYMEDLGDRCDGHPALIAAGYNGGWGNVSDWLRRRGDQPLDMWVEAIPYGQTRKYVKMALTHWWAYRRLYDGDAVPELSFSVNY